MAHQFSPPKQKKSYKVQSRPGLPWRGEGNYPHTSQVKANPRMQVNKCQQLLWWIRKFNVLGLRMRNWQQLQKQKRFQNFKQRKMLSARTFLVIQTATQVLRIRMSISWVSQNWIFNLLMLATHSSSLKHWKQNKAFYPVSKSWLSEFKRFAKFSLL